MELPVLVIRELRFASLHLDGLSLNTNKIRIELGKSQIRVSTLRSKCLSYTNTQVVRGNNRF